MLLKVGAEFGVALETSFVGVHARGELVVGIAMVHGVAGSAGELAAFVTGGFNEAVEFAAGDADHAVAPVAIANKGRFGRERLDPALSMHVGGPNQFGVFLEIHAGAKRQAVVIPCCGIGKPFDGVTLAADFG